MAYSTLYPVVPTKLTCGVPMPTYAHDGDAGLDLCATEDVTLLPGESCKMGSGVLVAIPRGFAGIVVPRSGLGAKGLVIKNGLGLIDATYRGEIGLTLLNNNPTHWWNKFHNMFVPQIHEGKEPEGTISVHKGDRVAQLMIVPVATATLLQVEELDETERADGGFGSTGISGGPRP